MKQEHIILVSAIILSLWFFYIWNQLSTTNPWFVANTISVAWEWKTTIAPDSMWISLNASELAPDTSSAQRAVNTKINQIKTILTTYEIPNRDIKTASVSIYPEYDWRDSGRNLLWHRATQTLEITVTWPDFVEKWWQIVDEISRLWDIQINTVSFQIKDKNQAMSDARENAFQDARAKAEQLAKFAWIRIKWVASITDQSIDYHGPYPMYGRMEMASDMWMWWTTPWADFSQWEMEVSVNLQVIFETR